MSDLLFFKEKSKKDNYLSVFNNIDKNRTHTDFLTYIVTKFESQFKF